MADINPFTPNGNTISLTVSTSAHAAVPLSQLDGYSGGSVVVYNDGPNTVFLAFGNSSVAAAIPVDGTPAAGIPVPNGATVVFAQPPGAYVSAICQSAKSATIYLTCGQGT